MDRRINFHGDFIRILARNLLIHVKKISVLTPYSFFSVPGNDIPEIKKHGFTCFIYPPSFIANVFGISGGNIPWNEVAKGRIPSFQVIVPVFVFYLTWSN